MLHTEVTFSLCILVYDLYAKIWDEFCHVVQYSPACEAIRNKYGSLNLVWLVVWDWELVWYGITAFIIYFETASQLPTFFFYIVFYLILRFIRLHNFSEICRLNLPKFNSIEIINMYTFISNRVFPEKNVII